MILMFSEEDFQLVLQDFPNFELSYEIITHKKVFGASAILAIPEGKNVLLGLRLLRMLVFVFYWSLMKTNIL